MIRLLIADDSALVRKLFEGIFAAEGDFDIRLARDGAEALALVKAFDPHVITLDVQMPVIDGLTCLAQIMIEAPRPVVMISSLTGEGADAALRAMELGATDFVGKPTGTVSLEMDELGPAIVQKVRAAAKVRISQTLRLRDRVRHQLGSRDIVPHVAKPNAFARFPISDGLVLIGTSTGGPSALDIVLPDLPADFPYPVMVAQHMPASFTGPFAKRLDRQCALEVMEVVRPVPLRRGTVYIGHGDADIVVSKRRSDFVAMAVPAQRTYPWHPSAERMVTSALDHYQPAQLIGVLMTGMGTDGANAMTRLFRAGGHTIAEAESTAVVWGMPGELVKLGGAEYVRPVDEIAAAIRTMVEAHAAR